MRIRFASIAAVVLLLLAAAPAAAETICLRSVLKNGKIVNTTKTVADGIGCPKGYRALLSTQALLQSGLQGPQGPVGPKGDTGLTGSPGSAATVNISSFVLVPGETLVKDSSSQRAFFIECPVGYILISCHGGVEEGLGVPSQIPVAMSYSGTTRFGDCYFRAFEAEPVASNWSLFGVALCVRQQ